MKKIIGVYKITNTATGDFYIGSSIDVKKRFAHHKCSSTWRNYPNNPMYLDMKKYGTNSFEFQVIVEAEIDRLKETEQKFIETLKPTYNNYRAKGWDIERYKEYIKEYNNKYYNQLCYFNSEKLTFAALVTRFRRAGIKNPTLEAKKYLLNNCKVK